MLIFFGVLGLICDFFGVLNCIFEAFATLEMLIKWDRQDFVNMDHCELDLIVKSRLLESG